ncbi:hypothetical protein IMG5_003180 [Ichthyophthirius multifiliis]|uniref:COMM domain-containing protein 5 n=1 Tax=Ichthyophthirius multifiliis TaxID=5932 RepID=G0QJ86_ICHMU|nr:hypothetical protein IMG5_003180 [Ichthyophthirius multifiliis]EGR34715.1 hypothetical protein IMG5_003180 [Ichthyophthirius multifiliis]|eukprot:XP_004040019.1 hypothetical protein IMG5_003180 [Ichthyophthirius multifiliis]
MYQQQKAQNLLNISLEVILGEKSNNLNLLKDIKNTLTIPEKVLTTKLIKVLKELAVCSKQQLKENLEQIETISPDIKQYLFNEILPNIYCPRTLNNYQLIKYHFDKKLSIQYDSQIVENQKLNFENMNSLILDFAKVEFKVEISLSSIRNKKILRPAILLSFHTKQGVTKVFYIEIQQFHEFRKNLALIMRSIHQIELK